jgi:hypothetical protein
LNDVSNWTTNRVHLRKWHPHRRTPAEAPSGSHLWPGAPTGRMLGPRWMIGKSVAWGPKAASIEAASERSPYHDEHLTDPTFNYIGLGEIKGLPGSRSPRRCMTFEARMVAHNSVRNPQRGPAAVGVGATGFESRRRAPRT